MSKIYSVSTKSIYTPPKKELGLLGQIIDFFKRFLFQKIFVFIPYEIPLIGVAFLPIFLAGVYFNLFFNYYVWIFAVLYLILLIALFFLKPNHMPLWKHIFYSFTFTASRADKELPQISDDEQYFIHDKQMMMLLEVKQLSDFDTQQREKVEKLIEAFVDLKIIVVKTPIDEEIAEAMTNEFMSRKKFLTNELYDFVRSSVYANFYGLEMNKIYLLLKTDYVQGRRGFSLATNRLEEMKNKIINNYSDIEVVQEKQVFIDLI
jgi:hypothetical protein